MRLVLSVDLELFFAVLMIISLMIMLFLLMIISLMMISLMMIALVGLNTSLVEVPLTCHFGNVTLISFLAIGTLVFLGGVAANRGVVLCDIVVTA